MHQVEALVDVLELQGMRDQIVDIDPFLHVPIDDLRHIGPPPRATEGGALPDAAGHQLKRPRADFLPRRGDTDDDADAPAAMAAFQCLPHRLHIADAFEAVIGAALCQIDEKGHEIAFHLLRIDEMRHAELLGEGAPARVAIDADNHIGTNHAAALYDVEPDALVALFARCYARPNIDDDAGALMSHDCREEALRIGARQRVGVGVAHAGRLDLDKHLAGFRPVEPHRFDRQGLPRFVSHRRARFHAALPRTAAPRPPAQYSAGRAA